MSNERKLRRDRPGHVKSRLDKAPTDGDFATFKDALAEYIVENNVDPSILKA